ncbi:MAG: Ig-like domain-containing protein [Bacteroidetes bacterium]|nr:Ig-like domain-containing protein [Bacteroidota bacterium]
MIRKIIIFNILIICGCADPRPPTGGPRDELPPTIVFTDPPHESVEVSPTEIKLTFSEYVNEGSFTRALSIVPAPQGRLEYKWRRRSVTVRLPSPLKDSTTYVVTLNDEFRDWHGVRLKQPLSFAFSTGPVIDQGRLRGRVIDSDQGLPVAGLLIFAYPAHTSINEAPAYQTQTDTEGRFEFSHVRESDFFVIGLRDMNRNLSADPEEWFASPPDPAITATPDTIEISLTWVYTKVDTLGPSIQRVRMTADQLIEIRFSEGISISDLSGKLWTITDSLGASPLKVYSSYQSASDPRVIYLKTESLQELSYTLLPDLTVQDSSGNIIRMDTVYFTGRRLEETLEMPKFQKFLPDDMENPYQLAPWESPGLVFDQPIQGSILDSLLIVQDSTDSSVDYEIQSSNGTTYTLTGLNDPAQVYQIIVQQPDSTYVRFFERLGPRSLGSLSGNITPSGDSIRVALTDSDGRLLATKIPDSQGSFIFTDLPENSYHLRAFVDRNQNDQWDGGFIHPYQPAEPITWTPEPLTIRPRWDTELPDTLRIESSSSLFSPTDRQ